MEFWYVFKMILGLKDLTFHLNFTFIARIKNHTIEINLDPLLRN